MKLKKIRNALLVVLTLALVSAAAVAITYAELNEQFNTETNNFTNGAITAELSEYDWDGKKGSLESGSSKTDAEMTQDANLDVPVFGKNKAAKYTPSMLIPKNPMVSNTTDDIPEWIAVKVYYVVHIETDASTTVDVVYTRSQFETNIAKFYDNDSTPAQITVSSNTWNTNWYVDDSKTDTNNKPYSVFYYTSIVNARNSTARLFDNVKINPLTPNASTNKYSFANPSDSEHPYTSDKLPTFDIKIKGYAIQAVGKEDNNNQLGRSFSDDGAYIRQELDRVITADTGFTSTSTQDT